MCSSNDDGLAYIATTELDGCERAPLVYFFFPFVLGRPLSCHRSRSALVGKGGGALGGRVVRPTSSGGNRSTPTRLCGRLRSVQCPRRAAEGASGGTSASAPSWVCLIWDVLSSRGARFLPAETCIRPGVHRRQASSTDALSATTPMNVCTSSRAEFCSAATAARPTRAPSMPKTCCCVYGPAGASVRPVKRRRCADWLTSSRTAAGFLAVGHTRAPCCVTRRLCTALSSTWAATPRSCGACAVAA